MLQLISLLLFVFLAVFLFVLAWVLLPDQLHGKVFGKRGLYVWLCCALAGPFLHNWFYRHVWDTPPHRRIVHQEIRELAHEARDENCVDCIYVLLNRAKSDYSFEAVSAVVAIGDSGQAAIPIVDEVAKLVLSDDPYVAREAARALSKLGPYAIGAVDVLEHQVANGDAGDDVTWFSAEALGAIGSEARKSLPTHRSRRGESPTLDRRIRASIPAIEASAELADP